MAPLKRKRKNQARKYVNHRTTKKNQTEQDYIDRTNLSLLDLPANGNYYITRKTIEECPMCYTPLDIRTCVVKITLLTYTYYCECGVTIYHIPHTPANITHPIKI